MLFNQYETVAWIIYTILLYIQMLWMFLYSEMARKTCDTFKKKQQSQRDIWMTVSFCRKMSLVLNDCETSI